MAYIMQILNKLVYYDQYENYEIYNLSTYKTNLQ